MSNPEEIQETLDKFIRVLGADEHIHITKQELDNLREVAKYWTAVKGVYLIFGGLGNALKWAALIVGTYVAIKAGLISWIRSL